MKKVFAVCVISFVALAAGVAMAADPVAPTGAKAVDAAFVKAMLAGDAAAVADCYADDAVLVMPGSSAVKGHKAILESLTGFLAANKVSDVTLTDTYYRTSGKLSTGWGHYSMVVTPKAGGAPMTDVGTFCEVASEKDGVWKYVSDHAASDPPPAKK
jgi:uncharacterized protein (TIGR02246 family)